MKELTVIFLSTFKFAATFPVAIMAMKMTFAKTLLFINIGGIIGVLFFTILSKYIIFLWDRYWPDNWKIKRRKKKVFTRKNRRMIRIRAKYGKSGIVILNPVILSIPVGSFLMTKYYGCKISNCAWLIAGQLVWSFIYAFFYMKVYQFI